MVYTCPGVICDLPSFLLIRSYRLKRSQGVLRRGPWIVTIYKTAREDPSPCAKVFMTGET